MNGAKAEAFLATHSRFRVVKTLLGFDAQDEIEIVARNYDPHASAWIWSFRRVTDGRAAHLTELANDHATLLRDLELYLAPM